MKSSLAMCEAPDFSTTIEFASETVQARCNVMAHTRCVVGELRPIVLDLRRSKFGFI
jgi:hypothetical protein